MQNYAHKNVLKQGVAEVKLVKITQTFDATTT